MPAAFTVTAAVSETQFWVLIYLACDNNLESACKKLLNNLELALLGYLLAAYTEGINVFPSDEVDTAYNGTLVEFTDWAQSLYPGHYTLLSLVGHGGLAASSSSKSRGGV